MAARAATTFQFPGEPGACEKRRFALGFDRFLENSMDATAALDFAYEPACSHGYLLPTTWAV
ncbi:MAG: hypothetical protein ACLU38_01090 [Dysosmobacter sp.]